jgi:hypothetical protein
VGTITSLALCSTHESLKLYCDDSAADGSFAQQLTKKSHSHPGC